MLCFLQQLGWMGRHGSFDEVHGGECAETKGPQQEAYLREEYKATTCFADQTKKFQWLDLSSC